MKYTKIVAEVVSEIKRQLNMQISCYPCCRPAAAGEKCHVILDNFKLVRHRKRAKIYFNYYISVEYRFKKGYDYCHTSGCQEIEVPPDIRLCPCSHTLTYTTACKDLMVINQRKIQLSITINFTILTCRPQIITVRQQITRE
ncbi:hypothetical protein JOC37_000661 [Desulfohalotomaculum tongense]|uniref:hypothetical protein n=1 Tax=Desulforadius tongensis TaxID=1216062 RepID=UPI00195E35C2|nr:hypothetical protein [Desulforadius tongensis]MBM7854288.1 hypothetical protein [Desulforadius tongensis]